ncbi:Nn.00g002440.m01.CDS01 [Neocucurbitaria sp. VM-36]
MPASHGQKVTTDPESTRNPIQEGVGTVTSDSLAADSINDGGSFGEGNPKAAASKQPSSSTTTNITDTSNATKLDPAVDAQAREAQEGWSEEKTISSGKGLGKESGVGPTYNSVGSGVNSAGDARGVSTGSGGFEDVQGNVAPTGAYAGQDLDSGVYKPKGKNVTEDQELKGNTKFGEIGTDQDPARVAELDFAKRDAASGAVSNRDLAQGGDSKFSALKDEGA